MPVSPLGPRVALPVGPSGYAVSGSTTVLKDGTLLIGGALGVNSQIYFEHLSAAGTKLGDVFIDLPSVPGFGLTGDTIRALTGGGFAVVFQFDNGNSRTQLYTQAYTASGVATSSAVRVNSAPNDSQNSGAYLLATRRRRIFHPITITARRR